MKKLLLLLLCVPLIGFGQTDNNNCSSKRAYNMETAWANCYRKINSSKEYSNKYKNADIAIEKIVSAVSIPNNFKLVECESIKNAAATIHNGKRYIIYDKDFLDRISERTNDFGKIFLLAHEIGHHINGDLISEVAYQKINELNKEETNAEKRKMELEADKFAGSVIARLGGSIEDATMPIRLMPNPSLNSTHPQTKDRIISIIKGYNNAKNSKLNAIVVNVNNTNTVYLDENSKDYQDIKLNLIDNGKVNNKIFTGVTITKLDKIGSFSEYYDYISIFEKDVTAILKKFYKNGINYMDRIEISTGEFIERVYDRKTINDNSVGGGKEKLTAWHNNGIKAALVKKLGHRRKTGVEKKWSKQGNLLIEESFNNGKRDGWQRRWTEVEGKQFYYTYLTREEFYENDETIKGFIKHGGKIWVKDNYECIDEVITERYENGSTKFIHIYVNSFLQEIIEYFENGTKRMSKHWIKGFACYNEYNLISPCITKIWRKETNFLQLKIDYKNEPKKIKSYHPNGKIYFERHISKGVWNGQEIINSGVILEKCWDNSGNEIECPKQ
jgi:hypothetical protein